MSDLKQTKATLTTEDVYIIILQIIRIQYRFYENVN